MQYANGTVNPDNACQSCIEDVSKTAWSPNGFGSCGPNGDRFCGGGVCCELGICPDLSQGGCGEFCDAVCAIGGVNGDRNPANPCEQCASSVSHTSWTVVAPNFYCDPDAQAEVWCAGTYCGSGMFCNTNGFFCDQ